MTILRSAFRGVLAGVLVVVLSTIAAASAHAQQSGVVRGTVTDSIARAPVTGVQVTITGSRLGAITNQSGEYTIRNVPAGTVSLSVTRLGFSPVRRQVAVQAGGTTTANFALAPIAAVLSEVVSVGYGTSSRHEVSSAIASIDSTAMGHVPVASLDNALQGKVAGVQVLQNSGEPGSGLSVRVRGPASLNAGNQPLYVVDGVPIIQDSYDQVYLSGQNMTAVTGLNPDEIATIDVLKDAAATAIYGSRGSNGVIMITTKRGHLGGARFALNAYGGTQSVEKKIGMLNSQQYVELMNESAKNDGYGPEDYDFTPGVDDAASYDWQDAVFRRAPVTNAQLSLSGGVDRLRYYGSIGHFNQRGIVIGSAYQRQSGRINLDLSATDKLLLTASIGLTREDDARVPGDQSLDGIVTNAIGMQPMRPIYGTSYGFGGDNEDLRYSNPVASAAFSFDQFKTLRALGNLQAVYHATDRFTVNGRAGGDLYGVDELIWSSPKVDGTYAASVNGVGRTGHTNVSKYVLEGYLGYDAIRNDRSALALTAGSSIEWNRSDLSYARGEGFPNGFSTYVRNAAAITSWDGSASDNNLVSYFSRANYSIGDKYLVSASLRADGSSRFGAENRYGIFPAVSAGWVVTDESFARGLQRFGTLKLRGSFGVTGNQGIGDYSRLTLASGTPYSGIAGVSASQLGNQDLRWESTKEVDVGADISTFGGRVGIIADYYRRNTDNLLVQRPIPYTSGYSFVWDNIGAIRNTGFDLGLHTINVQTARFGWNSDLNVTWNRNVVTALYGGQPITFTVSSRVTSIVAVGQPLGEFYLYRSVGVDPATGNALFATADGGQTMDPTSEDLTFVGNPQPNAFGGLTNTFTFGGLDLRAFLQFSQGNKVFNMMRIFMDDGGYTYDNKSTLSLARWQQPGDVTDEPRMSYDGSSGARVMASRMVEDGSFLRLGEVTLGYRLPQRAASTLHLAEGRVFVSGRNLKTWTKYSGYNPDVNSAGQTANVVMGVDYYAYPLARTYTVGITATW